MAGDGSKMSGVRYLWVGVDSHEPYPKAEARSGNGGGVVFERVGVPSSLPDGDDGIPSTLSNSGLSLKMIDFQSADAPGEGGWDGVYLRTISVQRVKIASVMWRLQLTANKKAISF